MRITQLELMNVRSYCRQTVDFPAGVTVIVGRNAQGKTNLLEAIYRLAVGSSHRVTSDLPLVRKGSELAVLRAVVVTDEGRRRSIELELRPGRGNRAQVDGHRVRRSSEAIGVLRVVLFSPEDVALVRGDPAERRRFLDQLLAQRRPAYASARAEFERILRQRNHVLRRARAHEGASEGSREALSLWTEQFVQHGAVITAARLAAVHALAGPSEEFHRSLAEDAEPIRLIYRSSAGFEVAGSSDGSTPDRRELSERFRAAISLVDDEERRRGVSLVGPQRDDLDLRVRDLPARDYASHGQVRTLALSLRLATYQVLVDVGDRPVVLLDDVFQELDETRRRRLSAACAQWEQTIVTTAVEHDVPLEGPKIDVWLDDEGSHATPRDRSNVA
ncbi:MAG: DNA replication/repair protein RecF [Nitriliruptorales bacterium]